MTNEKIRMIWGQAYFSAHLWVNENPPVPDKPEKAVTTEKKMGRPTSKTPLAAYNANRERRKAKPAIAPARAALDMADNAYDEIAAGDPLHQEVTEIMHDYEKGKT